MDRPISNPYLVSSVGNPSSSVQATTTVDLPITLLEIDHSAPVPQDFKYGLRLFNKVPTGWAGNEHSDPQTIGIIREYDYRGTEYFCVVFQTLSGARCGWLPRPVVGDYLITEWQAFNGTFRPLNPTYDGGNYHFDSSLLIQQLRTEAADEEETYRKSGKLEKAFQQGGQEALMAAEYDMFEFLDKLLRFTAISKLCIKSYEDLAQMSCMNI